MNITMIKLRTMRLAGHAVHMGKKRKQTLWQNKHRMTHTKQSVVCEMNFKTVSETYGRLETHLLG